jgi:arylsulfatase A-like enzyme
LIVDTSRPAPASFEAGWDEVARVGPAEEESGLEATVEAARAALAELAGRDGWLLWVDLGTPLPPWEIPEEFQAPYFEEDSDEDDEEEAEEEEPEEKAVLPVPITEVTPGEVNPADDMLYLSLQGSYAATVTYLDAGVGQLLEALAEVEGGNEVLVLFTTDCGQALGEHGVVGAVRPYLHDEVIHLPLLLRLPGGARAGRHVAALTQAVDVGPTLAEAFGTNLPGAQGHSLLPLARGEVEQVRAYACSGLRVGREVEWALRTSDWGFLLPLAAEEGTRGPQLHVKPDDRWEVNNVVQHHLEWSDRLEQTLRAFVSATRRAGPLEVPPLRDVEAE